MYQNHIILVSILVLLSPHLGATTAVSKSSISLSEYLSLVKEQSRQIQESHWDLTAAQSKDSGPKLPAPMIGVMRMTESGLSQNGYEVSQEVPFPSKLTEENRRNELEVQFQKQAYTNRIQETLWMAKISYFEFWMARHHIELLEQKRDFYQKHISQVRAAARSDAEMKMYLLEVDTMIDVLNNEIANAESTLQQKRLELSTYAPQLQTEQLEPVDPVFAEIEFPKTEDSNLVKIKEKELLVVRSEKAMKNRSYWPDLYVRFRSYNANEMNPANQELMLGITLPFLWVWERRAETGEAQAILAKTELQLQQARSDYERGSQISRERLKSLYTQIETYRDHLIPKIQKRFQFSKTLSIRSMSSLNSLRSVANDLFESQLRLAELEVEAQRLAADILKNTNIEVQ